MDTKEMLESINRVQRILLNLNTLVNKKWYDEQEEMIICIKNANDELNKLKNKFRDDLTKDRMIRCLKRFCDMLNCSYCPFNETDKKCPVLNNDNLSQDFSEVEKHYTKMREWFKSFDTD